jgi:hypothetical protein
VAEGSLGLTDFRGWFGDYLRAFAACARGDSGDVQGLLAYYGVPLLLTTDATALALTREDEVVDAVGQQIERLRAANYDRTETLDSETTVLNVTTTLHRADFSWLRADGTEIARPRVTYVVIEGASGRRMSVLAVSMP